jgi:hypothetical protein
MPFRSLPRDPFDLAAVRQERLLSEHLSDENGVARAPELLGVPGFGGIRIHVGNYAKDTEGCILVGKGSLPTLEMITQSRLAYREVMALLLDCEKRQEPAWLTIVNPPQPSAR